jgi:hypothetical protein
MTGSAPRRRSFAPLQLAAVAIASVLVGHWIGYVVAVPDAGLRETILLDSGHAYWLLAVKCALLLGAASLAAGALDALRLGLSRAKPREGWSFRHALPALALIQVAAFTFLEVSERVIAGEPLGELMHHDVFAWGILAQLLIAPVGALVLAWLGRALRRVVTAVARSRPVQRPSARQAFPVFATRVSTAFWRSPVAGRAPPA